MEQTVTIESLVEGCRKGNRQAQERLYKVLAPKMLGVCMRYATSSFEAEDMLQTGFIKVFGSIGSYRSEGSFEGWVRRIIVNTAIESYRQRARSGQQVELSDVHDGVQQTFAMDNLECEDLLKFIQALPDGYRMVFNMYAIEGFSHKEIAAALQISESASKSQLSRARTWLKQRIQQVEGGIYASR